MTKKKVAGNNNINNVVFFRFLFVDIKKNNKN